MSEPRLICPGCRRAVDAGQRYCPRCGEPVGQELVAELRELHGRLRALDALVAEGVGDATVAEARGRTLRHYLDLRRPQPAAVTTTTAPAAAVATAVIERAARRETATEQVPLAEGAGAAATGSSDTSEPAVPRGPVFSWRAFVAEQAVTIMAYPGGFLLLVATLSFEVGAWQALGNGVKLAVVSMVYAAFGGLGFALRRSEHLRTVGGAYLAVFALMTPLVALAAYRFALAGLGFPVAGMLCIAAAYACAIYLALAWRTGFATYGYLGWMSFVVAGLSVAPWAGAPQEWQVCALAVVAIGLLAGAKTAGRRAALDSAVAAPARALGAFEALAAGISAEGLGLLLWTGPASQLSVTGGRLVDVGAFACVAGALVALALLCRWMLQNLRPPRESLFDLLDWLAAAFAIEAAVGVAAWLDVSRETMALLLAALGVLCGVGAAALRARWARRLALRWGTEGLALALPAIGALLIQDLQPPTARSSPASPSRSPSPPAVRC